MVILSFAWPKCLLYCCRVLPEKRESTPLTKSVTSCSNAALFSRTLLRTYSKYGGFPGLITLSAASTDPGVMRFNYSQSLRFVA